METSIYIAARFRVKGRLPDIYKLINKVKEHIYKIKPPPEKEGRCFHCSVKKQTRVDDGILHFWELSGKDNRLLFLLYL
jgi:hypothetical protein